MNDFEKDFIIDEDMEDNGIYITLTDDEGNDVHFELIDEFEYENNDYAVMLPYEESDDEVVILRILHSENEDDDEYVSIDDEELLNKVFEKFIERDSQK